MIMLTFNKYGDPEQEVFDNLREATDFIEQNINDENYGCFEVWERRKEIEITLKI